MEKSNEVIYRTMEERDFDEIVAIEEAVFTDAWMRDDFETALTVKEQVFLVAEKGSRVVGYCGMWVIVDNGEIMNVAVAENARRQGIAERMLLLLMEEGRRRGAVAFQLEVRESNDAARTLYRKLGFEDVGRRKSYYSHPTEDAILMTRMEEKVNA